MSIDPSNLSDLPIENLPIPDDGLDDNLSSSNSKTTNIATVTFAAFLGAFSFGLYDGVKKRRKKIGKSISIEEVEPAPPPTKKTAKKTAEAVSKTPLKAKPIESKKKEKVTPIKEAPLKPEKTYGEKVREMFDVLTSATFAAQGGYLTQVGEELNAEKTPFEFMHEILSDKDLAGKVEVIMGKGWDQESWFNSVNPAQYARNQRKQGFINGICVNINKLENPSEHLDSFVQKTGKNKNEIEPFFKDKDWSALINFLFPLVK